MRFRLRTFLTIALAATVPAIASAAASSQQAPPVVRVQAPPPQNGSPDMSQVPTRPVRISGGVMAGQLLNRVDPVYPDTDAQGAVVLHAIIASDGTVSNLSVISGPEPLQKAAVEAVRQWTYRPYLLNGQPVEVDTTITVNFRR